MAPPKNPKSQRPDQAPESEISVQHAKGGVFDRDGHSPFPIVGIGASAGGLEAFRQLLGALPAHPGMAFVLVQHLAPLHESRLSELLARVTTMPVEEATHGRRVEVDHVYVIPPNCNLSIAQGVLHVSPRPDGHAAPYLPVDFLFRTLAEDQRSRSIGVVLSGTGSDGTLGLCEIKAVGGITFAQDAKSAAHTGMPLSARESGCADFVLDPPSIAERLVETRNHPYLAVPPSVEESELEEQPDEDYRRILASVRGIMGVDFQLYRRSTIRRRIMRRMALRGLQSPSEYIPLLEREKDEVVALYHDLLINVTSFFRDPEMFESLQHNVFPELAKRKSPTQPYRVWVPGCSTGQEAYSLAISLLEFFDTRPTRPSIQIFATDLSDQTALDKARSGVFPSTIEAEVAPERLRRFFKKEDHIYRIDKSIRDMCVFARHNVTADPPFSHLDLISCRNVLIYLSSPLQKKVMPTFHYALDVPGFLVLGSAESIGEHGDMFELIDRSHKIYTKKPVAFRPVVYFSREELRASTAGSVKRTHTPAMPLDLHKEADRILLGRFAPPSVLVGDTFEILQYRGKTTAYLEPPPGEPTANILKMAREGLFLELRSALTEAKKTGKIIKRKDVRVMSESGTRDITLEVLPVKPLGDDDVCFLVVFHDPQAMAKSAAALASAAASLAAERDDELAAAGEKRQRPTKRENERLRQELAATKEYLQSLAEQQDAANEELRSANEEILSSNEELQSTNEELETAKEELQSTNEELTTVNEQLQHRNVELSQLNNDLTNLLSSTNIPLVMVGSDLRIRRFTGAAKRLMNLLPTDIGRPIGDIRTIADIGDFDGLIADVIDRVQTAERELVARDGRWYTLRVAPYRTIDNKIEGAVVLLVDVDQIRRGQEELQEKNARLHEQGALIEMSHDAIIVRDTEDRVIFWNHGAEEMYGYPFQEARGRRLPELLQTPAETWSGVGEALRATGAWDGELHQKHRDGTDIIVYSREILLSQGGDPAQYHILSIKRNITEDKRMVTALQRADRQKDRFMATLAHELRNPIAPMKNAVEIMRLAGDNSFTMEHVREMLDRQVRQLAGIVEDLIDVSRIVERKIELSLERVTIETAVRTAIETARPFLESCGHDFMLDLPADPLYVHADPVRLSQILVNLLNNAAKFTPAGGKISLRVTSEGRNGDREVVLRVRDSGVGIDDELKSRLFDMFEQGKAAPEHGLPGLGVGLSLVGSLVQMHGGTVVVVSEGTGRGSEFVVRLPEIDPNDPLPRHDEGGLEATRAAARAHAEKILIVDDNRDQAESLGKVLQLLGHTVRLSYDGEEALREADDFLPDAVLLDLGLPKMSGYEVAERLRSHPRLKDVLLIAQTGWGQEQDRQRTREAGFDHHLVKPVDVLQVQRILSTPRNGRPEQEQH